MADNNFRPFRSRDTLAPEDVDPMSDTAREPWLFVRHPEWQPSYDMDGPLAVATRKTMLDRASADRMSC